MEICLRILKRGGAGGLLGPNFTVKCLKFDSITSGVEDPA